MMNLQKRLPPSVMTASPTTGRGAYPAISCAPAGFTMALTLSELMSARNSSMSMLVAEPAGCRYCGRRELHVERAISQVGGLKRRLQRRPRILLVVPLDDVCRLERIG